MQPLRNKNATLVDLLERVLDKGLVLNAEIVVSISGIPLLGVNLRAILAGMSTMLKYGQMVDLDKRIREYYRVRVGCGEPSLVGGETVLFRILGSYLYEDSFLRVWRVGYIYLTSRRLLLIHREPAETLLEISLEHIRDAWIVEAERGGWKRKEIRLESTCGIVAMHAEDTERLLDVLRKVVEVGSLRA